MLRVVASPVSPLLLFVLLLAGCEDEKPPPVDTQATVVAAVQATVEALPAPGRTPTSPPTVLSASPTVRPDNLLIVEVEVELDREAQVYVEYENEDAGRFRTKTTEAEATQHKVPIVRLRPSTTYSYETFAVDADGRVSAGAGGSFTTGELPEALATLEFEVDGKPTLDLILMDLWTEEFSAETTTKSVSGYLLVLDGDSNIVWYYASPNPIRGQPYLPLSIRQKPNYNLVYLLGTTPRPCCLREITPLGEIVDNLTYGGFNELLHSDHLILPDDRVLFLAWTYRLLDYTAQGGGPETLVLGDSMKIWDQKTGITREIWNTFDSLPIDVRGPVYRTLPVIPAGPGQPSREEAVDWAYANSVQIGPTGNYILSLPRLFQVISVSPDLKRVEWKLGGPNSDYGFPDPTDKFYGQHTASMLPNGNILVFDNGRVRPEEEGGPYSRVLELARIDDEMTAVKVWEYRPAPDIYNPILGSAYRLDNGNTLINFGTFPNTVVEADRKGAEVWKLVIGGLGRKASYRAYPFHSIMGETAAR